VIFPTAADAADNILTPPIFTGRSGARRDRCCWHDSNCFRLDGKSGLNSKGLQDRDHKKLPDYSAQSHTHISPTYGPLCKSHRLSRNWNSHESHTITFLMGDKQTCQQLSVLIRLHTTVKLNYPCVPEASMKDLRQVTPLEGQGHVSLVNLCLIMAVL
jgi:hypothetical protein